MPTRRRTRVVALAAAVLVVALVAGLAASRRSSAAARIRLYSEGIAVTGDGGVRLVPTTTDTSAPASLARAGDGTARAADRSWLAAGCVPGAGTEYADMARDALLDLHHLTRPNGAVAAAWSKHWRYVWPRDASFTAVALADAGHTGDALRILRYLQTLQGDDGHFRARYLLDGTGVPDDRGDQLDGTGWALWAADRVVHALPAAERADALAGLAPLVTRASADVFAATSTGSLLPPASSDYWELDEHVLTLGTAAPVLIGLESAADLAALRGDGSGAARLAARARGVDAAITRTFGVLGYPRRIIGFRRDAAVAFLLPPFRSEARADVLDAWTRAARGMARPAGGLAPGEGWKRDGVSWTPETALFAVTAAATGRQDRADVWLRWLRDHRTAMGSLPEKVLADGSPAAVAPLAWTSALVVMALAELDGNGCSPGT